MTGRAPRVVLRPSKRHILAITSENPPSRWPYRGVARGFPAAGDANSRYSTGPFVASVGECLKSWENLSRLGCQSLRSRHIWRPSICATVGGVGDAPTPRHAQGLALRLWGYCEPRVLSGIPASPDRVAGFVVDCKEAGKKPATVRRYLSTIARFHRAAELFNPCASSTWKSKARRRRSRRGRGKRGGLGCQRSRRF